MWSLPHSLLCISSSPALSDCAACQRANAGRQQNSWSVSFTQPMYQRVSSTNWCAHSSLHKDHTVIKYLNFPRKLQRSFPNGSCNGGHEKAVILYCGTITQLVIVQNLRNWINMLVNLQWLYLGKKEPITEVMGLSRKSVSCHYQRQARRPVWECTIHRSPDNSIFFLKQQTKTEYY